MKQRNRNKIKALVIGVCIIICTLVLIHLFGNYVIPWIIAMHS